MTLPSRDRHAHPHRAGFTLLEALIVLGILALILAVVSPSLRGPSPALLLQRRATDIMRAVEQIQARAIATRQVKVFETEGQNCDQTQRDILFYPDGTAHGGDLCLIEATATLKLRLQPLTGHLTVTAP